MLKVIITKRREKSQERVRKMMERFRIAKISFKKNGVERKIINGEYRLVHERRDRHEPSRIQREVTNNA